MNKITPSEDTDIAQVVEDFLNLNQDEFSNKWCELDVYGGSTQLTLSTEGLFLTLTEEEQEDEIKFYGSVSFYSPISVQRKAIEIIEEAARAFTETLVGEASVADEYAQGYTVEQDSILFIFNFNTETEELVKSKPY